MENLEFRGRALVAFTVWSVLFVTTFCNANGDGKTVEVVGVGECADCKENNLDTTQAFSGLRVTIDCKPENDDHFKTRGSGKLDKQGNFKVSLPQHLFKDGKLNEHCYAQLHTVSSPQPCPSINGLESSKLVFKSTTDQKHQFGLKENLKFSPITCVSASFWPHHHHNFPPLPKLPPLPPLKSFHHHYPHPPIYKKPLPPPVYKPHPVPVYKKPLPPPVPVYKPPVYKPPPVPVYKKPLPPPVPVYKPPVYKPHPVPVYKKPLPPPVPIYKPKPFPPIPHKPLPPLPKIPPFTKKPCPPLPKLPPKYFHHPKFGKWPPLPPFAPHHP
ncbi:hypothetical protein ERO13_A04G122900v2 [Gossypium hirsutum]|uniref:Proline-rich protein n=3 Tax=Gossypium TaxID=3633 RepID=A0A2P5WHE5_GOSBA|nr:proline-rich protein 2 [Gossypium hirsutum]KAB2088048.1 hypothetical protein ES319_A04G148000v1 [Gossypium barbadense]KAG4205766.1 hypothetical protein ERO13_A04G122900v2 [Gossypium hirsutum]PPR90509.1 hypothetical protein GOBAR_AA30182 [Gossypium barbadense]TYH22870.1 hypothetical protein ES288_A04G164800v1 [Gossypium darwinii]